MAAGKTYNLKAIFSCADKISPVLAKTRKNFKVLDRSFKNLTTSAGDLMTKLAVPLTLGGGAGLLGIQQTIQSFIAVGDAIDKVSARAGVATGALQKLRFAAELGGVSSEEMDHALTKLSSQMGKAVSGKGKDVAETFKALGIRLKDASGHVRSTADVMRDLAEAIKRNENPADRAAILAKIFGDELGTKLIPVLKDGAKGLDDAAKQAEELGIVMSKADTEAAAKLGDTMTVFGKVVKALGYQISAKLSPAMMEIITNVQAAIVANKALIAQNLEKFARSLAETIAKIDWSEVIKGTVRFFESVSNLIDMIGGFKTIIYAVAALMAGKLLVSLVSVAGAVKAVAVAIYGITGPVGLVVAAIAAAAYAIYANWDWICEKAKIVGDAISGAFGRAADAIKGAWQSVKDWFAGIFEWFDQKIRAIREALPGFVARVAGFDSSPSLSGASPALAMAGGGQMTGHMTISVKAENGAVATVESVQASGGDISVDSPGKYSFGGD